MAEAKPAYGRIIVDEEGAFWLSGYSDPSESAPRWDVLSPEHGRWDREFYTRPQALYGDVPLDGT